jgi:hypothetical protein
VAGADHQPFGRALLFSGGGPQFRIPPNVVLLRHSPSFLRFARPGTSCSPAGGGRSIPDSGPARVFSQIIPLPSSPLLFSSGAHLMAGLLLQSEQQDKEWRRKKKRRRRHAKSQPRQRASRCRRRLLFFIPQFPVCPSFAVLHLPPFYFSFFSTLTSILFCIFFQQREMDRSELSSYSLASRSRTPRRKVCTGLGMETTKNVFLTQIRPEASNQLPPYSPRGGR